MSGWDIVLRGMSGIQMNMASERRTELWGQCKRLKDRRQVFMARLRWVPPVTAEKC